MPTVGSNWGTAPGVVERTSQPETKVVSGRSIATIRHSTIALANAPGISAEFLTGQPYDLKGPLPAHGPATGATSSHTDLGRGSPA
jgi:hypothetical protein